MTYSRIESMASESVGCAAHGISSTQLPPPTEVDLVVDLGSRQEARTSHLTDWKRQSGDALLILIEPHVDLDAHDAARASGLGPMWGRWRLMRDLPSLLANG